MAIQNKDEFPSFLCSQVKAYHYVLVIGMRTKVILVLGGELKGCAVSLSCCREYGREVSLS